MVSPMAESSATRLSRLLTLVPWLQAHQGISLEECAEHFAITTDQLESDLWMAIVCGVPGYGPDQLIDIQFWDDGRIHVIDTQTLDRPLRLTPDEAVALLVGLRMLAQVPGVDGHEAIITAAAKLESMVEGPLDDIVVSIDVSDPIRERVTEALVHHQGLEIDYASMTSNEVTTRVVIPEHVHVVEGIAYLEAWCTLAEATRTFRVDRILRAEVATDPVTLPDARDTRAAPLHAVRLRGAPQERWVVDLLPEPQVQADIDGGFEVAFYARDLGWAASLVLSRGGALTVLEPAELAGLVSDGARAALRSYS